MLDVVPVIVSAVLLLILLPTVGYIFVTTNHKDVLSEYIRNNEENMRELRASLERLSSQMNNNFNTIIATIRNGKG